MKKVYLTLLSVILCVSQIFATLVIPPSDIGDMMHTSGVVVYGTVKSHFNGNESVNNFEIIDAIKGNFNVGQTILVQEYSKRDAVKYTRVSGDVNFEIGKNYLLFMSMTGDGTYKLQYLALSAYEEAIIEGKRVFVHNEALLELVIASPERVNLNGLKGVYVVSDLIYHLRDISSSFAPFNESTAGLQVYGTYDPTTALRSVNPWSSNNTTNRAPCGDDIPCHCTTVIGGDTSTPAAGNPDQAACSATTPGKFIDNNWTVCIGGTDGNGDGDLNDGGDAGGDPSTTTEVTDLMNAVTELNAMPGVNISFAGVSPCATACGANGAAGDAATCSNAIPTDNKVWVFFDDPCNEIPFDPTVGSCAGVLGVGGSFAFTTPSCHTDGVCGDTWQTNFDPFFIMNSGSGCVGQYSYTAVLIHEMLHAIGVGHIGGESGDPTITGTGCATIDGTTPNGNQCIALMNPVVCNANPGNNAPNFGLTALDEACTDWMYNPSNNSTCAITNVTVTNVVCSGTDVLTFDVTFDYVDADDDMNGASAFDIELGGTGVGVTGTVINSGTANTGNATVSVSQAGPTTGGSVTVRNSEIFACSGQDLTVIVPPCPLVCDALTSLPSLTAADVCAGSDIVVDLGGCNFSGLVFTDEVADPTCTGVNATWTDYLFIPAWNVFDADPTAGAANLLADENALGGCTNITLAAADFPNTTCDPIEYTVFLRAGIDRHCANIDNTGGSPALIEIGDYLDTEFQTCAVVPVTFTVNPVPSVAPTVSVAGCTYTINFNCPTESGTATFPSSPPAPAGTVNITVTNSQGGCSTTFNNIPFDACTPVELIAFTGEHRDGINYLNWQTASELDNDYFIVEHSLDGLKFELLGKVQGGGTTIELQAYQYMDIAPKAGINYYRLKQVDFGGTFDYSEVIAVSIKETGLDPKIYPSPTSTFLNIEINEAINAVEIIDLTGRIVLSKIYGGVNLTKLDVADLVVGTYFIRVQAETGTELVRFVKN